MAKEKKPFLERYKTYDPKTEGYGNSHDWKHSFHKTMGFEEASKILHDDNPYSILKLPQSATFADVKKAYRKLAIENHPDKHPEESAKYTAIMQKINAAYVILERKLK